MSKSPAIISPVSFLIKGFVIIILGSISVALVVLSQQKNDAIVLGKPPSTWITGRNIQGFFAVNNAIVLVPTITILFLCIPKLLSEARQSRLRLQLFAALLKTARKGISPHELLSILLKVLKDDMTTFVKQDRFRIANAVEKWVWIIANILIASGITLYLVVTQPGLATYSSSAKFIDSRSIPNSIFDQSTASCLQGNWALRAASVSRENYIYQNRSVSQAIYALGTVSPTTDVPISVIGFGNGLSVWKQESVGENWRQIPAVWRVSCNNTLCYTFIAGNTSNSNQNSIKHYVARSEVREWFKQLGSIDTNLIQLGSSSSTNDDTGLENRRYTQAVSYGILTGIVDDLESDIYRAAYLISVACGIDSKNLQFTNPLGFADIFSILYWTPRPVTILSACTTIWYQPQAFFAILILIIVLVCISSIRIVLLGVAWLYSRPSYWWPAVTALSSNGPIELLSAFPIKVNLDNQTGDFIFLEEVTLIQLYENHNSEKLKLAKDGYTEKGWDLVNKESNTLAIRFGKLFQKHVKVHDNQFLS